MPLSDLRARAEGILMLLCARSSHKYYRGLWYDAPHQAPPKWIGMDEVSDRSAQAASCVNSCGKEMIAPTPLTAGARIVGDRRCQARDALERIWSRPVARTVSALLSHAASRPSTHSVPVLRRIWRKGKMAT
eukprot:7000039-Prymnesium_polylepis.1